jgi:Mg2+ and Co2+ transporter CorA
VAQTVQREITATMQEVQSKELRLESPAELVNRLVAALILDTDAFIGQLAGDVVALEQHVLSGTRDEPEGFLESMFLLRQKLLAVQAMAEQNGAVMARAIDLTSAFLSAKDQAFLDDLKERYGRTQDLAAAQQSLLQGAIDLYQTRITTRMNVAMERLALLTAGALPVTVVASIYGMNLIVNQHTQLEALAITLTIMAVISGGMLWWAKRLGWW